MRAGGGPWARVLEVADVAGGGTVGVNGDKNWLPDRVMPTDGLHRTSRGHKDSGWPARAVRHTTRLADGARRSAPLASGVCALRQSTADMGKVARYTLLYYFSTTMGAVVLGIAIVNIVRVRMRSPGEGVVCTARRASNR